jgi:arsenite methyltransferase
MMLPTLNKDKEIEAEKQARASLPDSTTVGDQDAACCSEFYEKEWVREILDNNFHPGGEELTRRSVADLKLSQGARVADLGCGTGSSSLLLAKEYSYRVYGVDRGAANVARAQERAHQSGLDEGQLRFLNHDVSALPFDDSGLDAILAECSFSLIADQEAALCEFSRVLRPGGGFALSDMAIEGVLPTDIAEAVAPWTCLVNAHSRAMYETLFRQGGFDVLSCTDESAGLKSMIAGIKRKLVLIGTGMALGNRPGFDFDLASARHWLKRMQSEVDAGRIRYLLFDLRSKSAADF